MFYEVKASFVGIPMDLTLCTLIYLLINRAQIFCSMLYLLSTELWNGEKYSRYSDFEFNNSSDAE